jgi:hypothetical protein
VKILPKDPLVARTQGLWPADATVACVTAGDGPTSARVAIVDYNGFAPAKLLKDGSGFHGIAGRANSGLASNEYFMPVMGLIFLRHATNRFYEAKAAIEADKAAGRIPDRPLIDEVGVHSAMDREVS